MKQNKPLKSLDDAEAMLDRAINFMDQLDPNDPASMKQINLTLQMADRASKLCDTKIRFELMRNRVLAISNDGESKKISK